MPTQRYAVTQPPIETLFTWIKSGEIAIPEIQRPFVWDAIKVRNFLDSLYQGFPVGYLIAWKNPDVKLKVVNKDYKRARIRIAFHPATNRFEVFNPAIAKEGCVGFIESEFPRFPSRPDHVGRSKLPVPRHHRPGSDRGEI
jgi:hypothetical protein